MLQKLHDLGQLYKKSYKGFYSVRQEQFLTDKERGPDGAFGEDWGEVVEIEEENWYFKLSEHVDWLRNFIGVASRLHHALLSRRRMCVNALSGAGSLHFAAEGAAELGHSAAV